MKKDSKKIYDEISVVYYYCVRGLFSPVFFFLTQLNLQAVLPSFEFASDTVYFEICFRIMGNFSVGNTSSQSDAQYMKLYCILSK